MMVMTFTTFILLLLAVLRAFLYLQLSIDQKITYVSAAQSKSCGSNLCKLLKNWKLVRSLLSDVLVILPHPLWFLQGVRYTM